MSFWDRLLGRKPSSSETAKNRLQLVVVHDRYGLSDEILHQMQEEIIAVLSKYVDIDREHMDIQLTPGREQNRLVADIPIRPMRTPRN